VCIDPPLPELVMSRRDSYVPVTWIADGDADPPGEEAALAGGVSGTEAVGDATATMVGPGVPDPAAVGDGWPDGAAGAHPPAMAARATTIANERRRRLGRARSIERLPLAPRSAP
jgi:hypothetical protein